MNKKIDISVLPDGFLVKMYSSALDNYVIREFSGWVRFAHLKHDKPVMMLLNHWHFNNGKMVLPDGLVVEAELRYAAKQKGFSLNNEIYFFEAIGDVGSIYINHDIDSFDWHVMGVKIIGVTAEYEIDGKRLGLEVVEL